MFRTPNHRKDGNLRVGPVIAGILGWGGGHANWERLQILGNLLVMIVALVSPTGALAWQMKQAPLMTDWAQLVNTNNPLPEYPRPQLVRTNWLNLNGIWQFQAGATNDAVPTNQILAREILVPFPMESALSGI